MRKRLSLSGEAVPRDLGPFEAIGLVRPEFVLRNLGQYLSVPTARAALHEYVRDLVQRVSAPIWYRCADLWSDEANGLAGVEEPLVEENPIIGVRGLRRHLRFTGTFEAEIRTILDAADGASNLHLLFPFVMDVEQFRQATGIARRTGWTNRLGAMIEIPSAAMQARELAEAGASNLLIGLNDLSCLTLGAARGEYPAGKTHPALWKLIEIAGSALGDGFEWGIAGSMSRDVVERAERAGVPYASIHYAELPDLLGLDPASLPDLDFVRGVKEVTRGRKTAAERAAT